MPRHPQSESAQAERSQTLFPWHLVETENDGILITANSFRPYRARWLQLKCSGGGADGSTAVEGRQGIQTTRDEADRIAPMTLLLR